MNRLRFATRLLLVILSVAILSMTAIFAISYHEMSNLSDHSREVNRKLGDIASERSRSALIEQAETYLVRLAGSQANGYSASIDRIQNQVRSLASFMAELYAHQGDFTAQTGLPKRMPRAQFEVAPGVRSSAEIDREKALLGHAYSLFRKTHDVTPAISAVYVGTKTGILFDYSNIRAPGPGYDARTRPWYKGAVAGNGVVRTGVYTDAATGKLTTTIAQAFYGPGGTIRGVVAVDVFVSSVIADLANLRIGETGFAFLLDAQGHFIAHTQFLPEDLEAAQATKGQYGGLLSSMASGESGVKRVRLNGKEFYVAYAPLRPADWSLGIGVEYHEIVAGALAMNNAIKNQARAADQQILERLHGLIIRYAVLMAVALIIVVLASIWLARTIAKPITRLASGVAEVGSGNLDAKIEIAAKDEIGALATSFNAMTEDLKAHIANLSAVTAEKERINSDLRIATDIQTDMLPKIFPPYSGRDDLQIAAFMKPAREVGGDFYDFFFLDDKRSKIALVIADVSGKSVSAALFMVIAKTLIKNNKDLPPEEVLRVTNNLLCEDNNASMFVTTYYSVLDIATGTYCYASAGHDPTIVYRAKSRMLSYLDVKAAPPLGVFPNKSYERHCLTLEPRDAVLLYTDGVTEAFNSKSELYGPSRLTDDLADLIDEPAQDVVDGVYHAVESFADGEPQADDITMLFCRYLGWPDPEN